MNAKLSAAFAALALGFPLADVAADETMPSVVAEHESGLSPYEYQEASSIADQIQVADASCHVSCSNVACKNACLPNILCGLVMPSDHCFDSFISPMTNPVFFEDPRQLTEVRGIFLQHKVPLAAGGGDVQLYAAQARARITERLSIIATKDGYIVSQNPLIADGWADVAAGLKYTLYSDAATQRLLSGGLTYEIPAGTPRTLQGNGDGEFHLFLSGGAEIFDYGHVVSGSGFRLPSDSHAESQMWYWSNHLDYQVLQNWYLLTEYNWYHWMKSGDNTALAGVEGGDLFNFGSTGVAGNDIVTGAFGAKYKPNRHVEIGVAWELPLTERRDILENRLTVDAILRY
ncbi:MAG: hypothetical protein JNL18_12940 [Planctomycetaceae bacterium]|nr:hypothetical protein [Planctomycetaceae bacterium]